MKCLTVFLTLLALSSFTQAKMIELPCQTNDASIIPKEMEDLGNKLSAYSEISGDCPDVMIEKNIPATVEGVEDALKKVKGPLECVDLLIRKSLDCEIPQKISDVDVVTEGYSGAYSRKNYQTGPKTEQWKNVETSADIPVKTLVMGTETSVIIPGLKHKLFGSYTLLGPGFGSGEELKFFATFDVHRAGKTSKHPGEVESAKVVLKILDLPKQCKIIENQ